MTRYLPDLPDDPLRLASTCPLRAAWMARDPAAEVEVAGGVVLVRGVPRARIRVRIGAAQFQLTPHEAETCSRLLRTELVGTADPHVSPMPLAGQLLTASVAALEALLAEKTKLGGAPIATGPATVRMADPYFQTGESEDAA